MQEIANTMQGIANTNAKNANTMQLCCIALDSQGHSPPAEQNRRDVPHTIVEIQKAFTSIIVIRSLFSLSSEINKSFFSSDCTKYSTLIDKNRPQYHFVCFVRPAVILREVKEMDLSSVSNKISWSQDTVETVCRPHDHFVLDLTLFLPNSPPTPSDTVNQGSQAICIIIVQK